MCSHMQHTHTHTHHSSHTHHSGSAFKRNHGKPSATRHFVFLLQPEHAVIAASTILGSSCAQTNMGSWYAAQHVSRVDAVAEKMYFAFVKGDEGDFIARTGNLIRSNTLRTKKTKEAFEILLSAKDEMSNEVSEDCRFWTKALVSNALKQMMSKHEVEVPQLPGFSWANWLKKQTNLVHSLCKRATRNRKGGKIMATPDTMQTVPMEEEELFEDQFFPVVVGVALFRIVLLVVAVTIIMVVVGGGGAAVVLLVFGRCDWPC